MFCDFTHFYLFVGKYREKIEKSFGYMILVMIELSEEIEKEGEEESREEVKKARVEICV